MLRAKTATEDGGRGGVDAEAVSALVNLGYRQKEAERVVREVARQESDDLAEVIRLALKRLST